MKQMLSLGLLVLLSLSGNAQAETRSAVPQTLLSPATLTTVHGQSHDSASVLEESAQKTSVPSGSDLKKAQEAQALFEESLRQMMPLDKEHIQEYPKRSDQRERALLPVSPDLRTRTVRVTLEPGRAPVKVFTTANIATSLVFHDSTGQPWPITSVTNGGPSSFQVLRPELPEGNLLNVMPIQGYATSTLVVTLENRDIPLVIRLESDSVRAPERKADALVLIQLAHHGPKAAIPLTSTIKETASSAMLSFLDRVPPDDAVRLRSEPDSDAVMAWKYNGKHYVRTTHSLMWPAWTAVVNGAGSTKCYELPVTTRIMLSREGSVQTILLKNTLKKGGDMAITSTEKKRRFILFSLLGLAAAVVIVLASFLLFSPEKPSGSSKMASARTETVSGQAGGVGSEEYNQKLKEHDAQQANAALQSGASFIPTPVGEKKPVVVKKQDTPPSPPPVAQVRTVPVQTPRTDNAMLKRMMDDLAELDTRLASASVGQGQIAYVREFPDETGQHDSEKKPAAGSPSVAASSKPAVKPGDLLYAIIDVGVNSDVPSAVLATVTSGTYRNARLTGSFQRHDERLVLAFNRIILPSGETIQLESYAVDPTTSEASVASSVDTHFFSRWGGLVASAFLEGLGTAKRYSGAQSTIYGYGNDVTDQMVWNIYSVSDQAWIAAGKVGEKAGKIFEKNFDRPPTVRLESGTPVGILVMNVKDR